MDPEKGPIVNVCLNVKVNNTDISESLVEVDYVRFHSPQILAIRLSTYHKYVEVTDDLSSDRQASAFSFVFSPCILDKEGELEGEALENHPDYYRVVLTIKFKDLPFNSTTPIIDALTFQYQILFIDSDTYWGKEATPLKFNVNQSDHSKG